MQRVMTAAVFLSMCAALFGCSTAKAPGVALSGMTASFDEPDGAVLWFELRVENTDTVDLPLAEARYSVQVGGETVFRGVRSCEATAPARGEAVVRLPASVPGAIGVAPGQKATIRGRLTYLTPSRLAEVLFDADLYRPEKGFTASATIPGPAPGAD
ncbi:MAG: LEA type 2 family protein [Phycisphaeraceae bacterium]|nr:LEA type 2 family protein [Phycisphaeraceae bacterium]MCB9847106.1 LEA type 2 family protein [Phycisphaeraceae bacterium]